MLEGRTGPTVPRNLASPGLRQPRHALMRKMPHYRLAGPIVSPRLSIPSPDQPLLTTANTRRRTNSQRQKCTSDAKGLRLVFGDEGVERVGFKLPVTVNASASRLTLTRRSSQSWRLLRDLRP